MQYEQECQHGFCSDRDAAEIDQVKGWLEGWSGYSDHYEDKSGHASNRMMTAVDMDGKSKSEITDFVENTLKPAIEVQKESHQ